jgi:hypothetical protein
MERALELKNVLKVTKPEPLKDKNFDNFFVETDAARGVNSALQLADFFDVNQNEPQKVLFMGHRGSGKSTELFRFGRYVEQQFKVINFSIRDEMDIVDLEYVDLIFVILRKLFEQAQKDGIAVNEHLLDNLDHYWHDEQLIEDLKIDKANIETGGEVKGGIWNIFSLHIKGILSTGSESKRVVRQYVEPRISKLITSTNDLFSDLRKKYEQKFSKTLILIIEDLDKLDIAVAEELFLKRKNILTGFDIHVIYTFPIFLHYSGNFNEIGNSFDHYELLSMIKVNDRDTKPYANGREIIRKIIEQRADLALFDKDALDFIIAKSGGSLRHVFEMLQNAVLDVRGRNRNAAVLDLLSAERAYRKLRNSFERTIARNHLDTLKELYKSKDKKPMTDGSLNEMLNCMAVIEYNGDRWCGLHPAVEDILKEKGEIGTTIATC